MNQNYLTKVLSHLIRTIMNSYNSILLYIIKLHILIIFILVKFIILQQYGEYYIFNESKKNDRCKSAISSS